MATLSNHHDSQSFGYVPERGTRIAHAVALIELPAHLTHESAALLHDEVTHAVCNGASSVILDGALCESMNSTGLAVLINLHKLLRVHGGMLALAGLREQPYNLILYTRMHRIFNLYETLSDAARDMQA